MSFSSDIDVFLLFGCKQKPYGLFYCFAANFLTVVNFIIVLVLIYQIRIYTKYRNVEWNDVRIKIYLIAIIAAIMNML